MATGTKLTLRVVGATPTIPTIPTIPTVSLRIIPTVLPSPCVCYILRSTVANRIYIGFTVNFAKRLRQHNGEIADGAKYTTRFRPWTPLCIIQGFYEQSAARRFEWRLQHPRTKPRGNADRVLHVLNTLTTLITNGDGNKQQSISWPKLTIKWYDSRFAIEHPIVTNTY